MNRCPITYEYCDSERYSRVGLQRLHRSLSMLQDLPFSAAELRHEAVRRAGRMSLQGIQLKLSAKLNPKEGIFEIVDSGGTFILKPQSELYPELPENEDLTMRLASEVGIEIPLHGLVHAQDGSRVYFIKRFDRAPQNKRLAVEDFAQLTGRSRDTKYDSSMEQVAAALDYCTFPAVERLELFRRTLFCFLTGNEDMHLKNFSLITKNNKVSFSPAYDLLNSTLVLDDPEELALPLHGKKRNLTRKDLLQYFGEQRLELTRKVIDKTLARISSAQTRWQRLVESSFLSPSAKQNYFRIMESRWNRLFSSN